MDEFVQTDPLLQTLIDQGFLADDRGQMAEVLARPEFSGGLDGFVFRLTIDMSPWTTAATANEIAINLGVAASLHLRMSGANPALEVADDHLTVTRVAEAMAAAAVSSPFSRART